MNLIEKYTKLICVPGLDHLVRGFASLVVSYARLTVRRSIVGVIAVALLVAPAAGVAVAVAVQVAGVGARCSAGG